MDRRKQYCKIGVLCIILAASVIVAMIFLLTSCFANNEPVRRYLLVETTDPKQNIGLPVITVAPNGIGNQLFEFACVYAIARKRNSNVYVLKPSDNVSNATHDATARHFSLDHFKIPFSKVVDENFKTFGSGKIFDFQEHHIWENSLPTDSVLRLNDVCVSEVYFKEYRKEIMEMFTLNIDESPIREMLTKVENTESVSVHVRRGDYLHSNEKRGIAITYQIKAMDTMKRLLPNATFFVFSDDLAYVREKLSDYENVIFVNNTLEQMSSLLDFLIMSKCKHNIISNSTYSWWAAYLNRNKKKIVIGPSPRHPPGWNELHYGNNQFRKYRELIFSYYMYPTNWLTLNPFEY